MLKLYFYRFLIILLSVLAFSSCRKDTINDQDTTPVSDNSSAQFTFQLKTNNPTIIWDSLNNTNPAGNVYSIKRVNFYISNIFLAREDGFMYRSNQIFYIDPSVSDNTSFQLDSIPRGKYTEIFFLIGIDSIRNKDGALASTKDNINMAWPTMMGGGYHFAKIEGHFIDSSTTSRGYAVHLGRNENLVKVHLNQLSFQQTANHQHQYSIFFNINSLFDKPYLYDLNKESSYTMSDSVAMLKIKTNMENAFTIIQNH